MRRSVLSFWNELIRLTSFLESNKYLFTGISLCHFIVFSRPYCWLLVPYIDKNADIKTIIWDKIRISGGSENIVNKASKKMLQNEQITIRTISKCCINMSITCNERSFDTFLCYVSIRSLPYTETDNGDFYTFEYTYPSVL